MNRQPIRKFGGEIIGWVETDSNGNQTIRNFSGKCLGSYDTERNVTRKFGGEILSSGNTAASLIYTDLNS